MIFSHIDQVSCFTAIEFFITQCVFVQVVVMNGCGSLFSCIAAVICDPKGKLHNHFCACCPYLQNKSIFSSGGKLSGCVSGCFVLKMIMMIKKQIGEVLKMIISSSTSGREISKLLTKIYLNTSICSICFVCNE